MEDVSSSSSKRPRSEPEESPEAKRIRADVFDILSYDDDETDSGDDGSAVEDLACVMQSLQEEISTPSDGIMLSNLDYLLEASDDELGLPPTVSSPAWDVISETEAAECGQIWGFGDDFHLGFSDDLDFQIRPETADGVVMFDDGLFDDFSGAAEFF